MSLAFFDALFPKEGSDGPDLGYVVLCLFPGGRFDPAEGPVQQHYFAWPSQRDDLVAFCVHNRDNDIYTVPALYKQRGSRKADNISHMWAAYADADTLKLNKLRAEPTLVVETSPGRHHLYWVTSTDDPERLVEISRNIAHTHADDGCDKSGWDAGQLLRVPGTTNNKNATDAGIMWEVQLKAVNEPYDIKRLEDLYPKVNIPLPRSAPDEMPLHSEWADEPAVREDAQRVFQYNPDVWDMFSSDLREGQDRSATMWRMLSEMARYGTSRTTAMYIAWNAKCNKYRLDGRSEEELWVELCRAFDDPSNQPITTSFQAAKIQRKKIDEMENNPEKLLKEFAEGISLLSDEERLFVPDDSFVDRYVNWAMTRTDAPETYHRSVAVTMLTAVFGEYGTCPTKFDSNLTLWFLLLGPTTRARKTTAMMLGMDMLADLQDTRHSYLLGSDVTSEALSAILPKRDGQTSVFYRDEAHGLLYEQDKKRYLAGLREHMTELYGGRVRMALRASNANDQEEPKSGNIRTNFVMFLCGTMDQVTSALTIDDYQSGHLARFLVAEADPPPMTKADMEIEQYDGSDRGEDVMRQALINDLAQARAHWEREVRPRRTAIVPFEPDAWQRLMDVRWDIYNAAQQHEMAEVLTPTTDRMGTSVMKCAVLLAMSEKEPKVKMRHILKAIWLAEDWYTATAKIAGRIMHSSWSAQQEEILSMVSGRKDGVTEYEIYSRFRARMQAKEIESNISVLVKANLIRRVTEKGRIRYIRVQRL